jgi:hypothetical protein
MPLRPYGSERDPGFEGLAHQRWVETGHAIGHELSPFPNTFLSTIQKSTLLYTLSYVHAPPRTPSFNTLGNIIKQLTTTLGCNTYTIHTEYTFVAVITEAASE